MQRSVQAFLPVAGVPAALERVFSADPGRWLPNARHVGPGHWVLTVRAGRVQRTVDARLGGVWHSSGGCWRALTWEPMPQPGDPLPVERLLPSMEGELGLLVHQGHRTLAFDGHYRPPGGYVGAVADGVALHRVARGTAEQLLADITARLTAEAVLAAEPPGTHRLGAGSASTAWTPSGDETETGGRVGA